MMAAPTFHITNTDSFDYGAANGYTQAGPGKLVMDADAFLIADFGALVLTGGPWTATINGIVTGPISSSGFYAIQIGTNHVVSLPGTSVTFGATAEISGYAGAVSSFSPFNVTNRGTLTSVSTGGAALFEGGGGNCKINNSGTLISGGYGLLFSIA
jgi:hypothetical protein